MGGGVVADKAVSAHAAVAVELPAWQGRQGGGEGVFDGAQHGEGVALGVLVLDYRSVLGGRNALIEGFEFFFDGAVEGQGVVAFPEVLVVAAGTEGLGQLRHGLRNALIPIVSLVVGWFLGIFSGSLVIENMFALNGMGRLMIQSLRTADYDVVLLMQMFYVAMALLGNLIIDLVYGLVDPRVRVSK